MSSTNIFKKKFKKKLYLYMNKINIDSDDEYINLSPSTTNIIFEHKNTEYIPINILWITNDIINDKKYISYLKSIIKFNDIINIFSDVKIIKEFFIKNNVDLIIINAKFIKKKILIDFFIKNNINLNQCIILSKNNIDTLKYPVIKYNNFELKVQNIINNILRIPKIHLRSLKKKGSWSSKTYIHKFKNNII